MIDPATYIDMLNKHDKETISGLLDDLTRPLIKSVYSAAEKQIKKFEDNLPAMIADWYESMTWDERRSIQGMVFNGKEWGIPVGVQELTQDEMFTINCKHKREKHGNNPLFIQAMEYREKRLEELLKQLGPGWTVKGED